MADPGHLKDLLSQRQGSAKTELGTLSAGHEPEWKPDPRATKRAKPARKVQTVLMLPESVHQAFRQHLASSNHSIQRTLAEVVELYVSDPAFRAHIRRLVDESKG